MKGDKNLKTKVGQGLRFNRDIVTWALLKRILKYLQLKYNYIRLL